MTWTPDMAEPKYVLALAMACCPWAFGASLYAADRDAPAASAALPNTPPAKSKPAGEDEP